MLWKEGREEERKEEGKEGRKGRKEAPNQLHRVFHDKVYDNLTSL